jgi:hypothetical protein
LVGQTWVSRCSHCTGCGNHHTIALHMSQLCQDRHCWDVMQATVHVCCCCWCCLQALLHTQSPCMYLPRAVWCQKQIKQVACQVSTLLLHSATHPNSMSNLSLS